jgi:small subunit ribosomal protein S17
MMESKNIGMGIKSPENSCNDRKCPFHGTVKVRGRTLVGTVISAKMHNTATIEWTRTVKVEKYERYTKKRSRVKAHNPVCLKAEEGDIVKIMESAPLSKTVSFIIVEKIGKEKGYTQRKEALEESKKRAKKEEEELAAAKEEKDKKETESE